MAVVRPECAGSPPRIGDGTTAPALLLTLLSPPPLLSADECLPSEEDKAAADGAVGATLWVVATNDGRASGLVAPGEIDSSLLIVAAITDAPPPAVAVAVAAMLMLAAVLVLAAAGGGESRSTTALCEATGWVRFCSPALSTPQDSFVQRFLQLSFVPAGKPRLVFNFSDVCPEPVSAKLSGFLVQNGIAEKTFPCRAKRSARARGRPLPWRSRAICPRRCPPCLAA